MGNSAMRIPLACVLLTVWPVMAGETHRKSTSDQPPRKVIVGTVMQAFWGTYPGLAQRLSQLLVFVDRIAETSQQKYGRGPDLVVLPEVAITGEISGNAVAQAIPFAGPVRDAFTRKARERHCYIVVPMYMLEENRQVCSNVGILVGRGGEVLGTYRKLHLAVPTGGDSMEGGTTPGKEVPVFDCDFGKLGIQICFDMEFDSGWRELARKGAELVAWPTQSPQTAHPAFRALQNRYYIVSSTWRNNASIFEPTGRITAQIRPPQDILVEQLDLSYAILPWSSKLRNGAALKNKYGEKVGYRYYEDEDRGIFWSNDPSQPIGRMVRSLGLTEEEEEIERIQGLYRRAGLEEH
ncbi:MAG TPA: carbon-nitrogen hydrolase family protein [Bryobacteraceae bacterium]|nr:carbon-nitrogen hydrolase family protein [Bryobacteraceae bacterium]